MNVYIELTNENAVIPSYNIEWDAGMDLYSPYSITIPPQETVVVKLGFKLVIPKGWEGQIRPRSGMSLTTPIRVANAPGTIDSQYRDEVGVILTNTSLNTYIEINRGDRVAQILFKEVPRVTFQQVASVLEISPEDRGGGFGSSGK